MSKRGGTVRLVCTFPDCREIGFMDYDNQREAHEIQRRRPTWRCVRHHNDGLDVLTNDRRRIVHEVASLPVEELPGDLFWREPGSDLGGSGFAYGPGFKAYAADFPTGTVLRVTAEVILPESEPPPSAPSAGAPS